LEEPFWGKEFFPLSLQTIMDEQLKSMRWLDPTIPIYLAKKIRDDQGDSFADSFDNLLPNAKYSLEQADKVKELVRQLVDVDNITFFDLSQMSDRLVPSS
jgi:hypothetical protein